jgi:hypothetical protein
MILITSLLVITVILLSVSMAFNIKHAIIILNMQDSIELCLDTLNIQYKKTKNILEIPIFFDSVEVRHVIATIRESHDAILKVAHILTSDINTLNEEVPDDD